MWKKIVPVALLAIVLVYSGLWYRHASQTEASARKTLEAINGDQGVSIAYDALEVSGYPFEFAVHMSNPRLTMDTAKLRTAFFPGESEASSDTPGAPADGIETVMIDGEAVMTVNYFTRSVGLRVKGVSHGKSGEKETGLGAWKSSEESEVSCTVTLTSQANMSIFDENAFALLQQPGTLAQHFKSMDCLADPLEIVSEEKGDMLYRAGEQLFSVSIAPASADAIEANLALVSNDMEVSDDWRERMKLWLAGLRDGSLPISALPMQSYAAVGKQNAEIRARYFGPGDLNRLGESNRMELEFSSFRIANDLYEMNIPLHFSVTRNGDQLTGSLTVDGKAAYSPEIDRYAGKTAELMAQSVYADIAASPLQHDRPSESEKQSIERSIAALIPAFGTFKTARLTVDSSFKGTVNPQMLTTGGEMTLNNLELLMGDYGFSATGNALLSPPRAEVSIRCHACDETVDKLVLYLTELRRMIALIDPMTPSMPEGKPFRQAVAGLIEKLSVPAEDKPEDRVILISSSGAGEPVISGKPMHEVMVMAMETFVPFLEQIAPPQHP